MNVSNQWAGALGFANYEILDNSVLVENNYFIDNEALQGGAILSQSVLLILRNNVFSGNYAENFGGALYLENLLGLPGNHSAILINNSFAFNASTSQGGSITSIYANPLIFNCILWHNSAPSGWEIFINSGGYTEIACSNIDTDKISGPYFADIGIMNEDPLFEGQVYLNLSCESPCRNEGISQYTCGHNETYNAPEYDINGDNRPLDGGFDLGAYETCVGVGIGDEQLAVGGQQSAVSIFPNPTYGMVDVRCSMFDVQRVTLTIYDMHGRAVSTVLEEQMPADDHIIQFDASRLPAGVYFCEHRAKGEGQRAVGKLVKF